MVSRTVFLEVGSEKKHSIQTNRFAESRVRGEKKRVRKKNGSSGGEANEGPSAEKKNEREKVLRRRNRSRHH